MSLGDSEEWHSHVHECNKLLLASYSSVYFFDTLRQLREARWLADNLICVSEGQRY